MFVSQRSDNGSGKIEVMKYPFASQDVRLKTKIRITLKEGGLEMKVIKFKSIK